MSAMVSPGAGMRRIHVLIDCSYDALSWTITVSEDERQGLCRQLECSTREYMRYIKHRRQPKHLGVAEQSCGVEMKFVGVTTNLRRTAERMKLKTMLWPCQDASLGTAVAASAGSPVLVLSPDAAEALSDIAPGTVLIIGGFVDRPTRPGVSLEVARSHAARGWQARRLPIAEHSGLPAWMFLAAGEGHASQGGGDLESEEGAGAMAVGDEAADVVASGCSTCCGVCGHSSNVSNLSTPRSKVTSESAQVLSINAVVACVLGFVSSQSWQAAIRPALPAHLRKLLMNEAFSS